MKTASQYFKEIIKVESSSKMHYDSGRTSKWEQEADLIRVMLKELLYRDDFIKLGKEDLLHAVSMMSTYRPMEPHRILTHLSMQYDNLMQS